MQKRAKRVDKDAKKTSPPSPLGGGISPNANTPGNSIDEHRKIESANISLTGDEIRQQNENL